MVDFQSDPVRTYLLQMGSIPMLSRREEIAAAQRIEKTRTRFRRALLATDYALQGVAGIVGNVLCGSTRLERVIGISVQRHKGKEPYRPTCLLQFADSIGPAGCGIAATSPQPSVSGRPRLGVARRGDGS